MYIIGCDEVGTGSGVACLVVCGVKAAQSWNLTGLNDSKKLSPKKRNYIRDQLYEQANNKIIEFYISEQSNEIIDQLGLATALKNAYIDVFNILYDDNSSIIVDGNLKFDLDMNITSIVKADSKIPTVMAASIIAKTYRDRLMQYLHEQYPVYGWDKNVGYLTSEHKAAIKKYGLSPLHRKSYKINLED